MYRAFPQSVGIGGVVGTIIGNLLMAFAGYGETAVYMCALAGGCLSPVIFPRLAAVASRARRLGTGRHRPAWSSARLAAFGR